MIVNFAKNLYPDHKDLWFAYEKCAVINDIITPLNFFIETDADNFIETLQKSGFAAHKEERCFGPDEHERYFCIFLKFDDQDEEARFIVWASGGIEYI